MVPKVRFERDKYHKYADVIVVAAPNARRARTEYHIDNETLVKAMRNRIRFVMAIAASSSARSSPWASTLPRR